MELGRSAAIAFYFEPHDICMYVCMYVSMSALITFSTPVLRTVISQ